MLPSFLQRNFLLQHHRCHRNLHARAASAARRRFTFDGVSTAAALPQRTRNYVTLLRLSLLSLQMLTKCLRSSAMLAQAVRRCVGSGVCVERVVHEGVVRIDQQPRDGALHCCIIHICSRLFDKTSKQIQQSSIQLIYSHYSFQMRLINKVNDS